MGKVKRQSKKQKDFEASEFLLKASRKAKQYGCYAILLNASRYIKKRLTALLFECTIHSKSPDKSGVTSLSQQVAECAEKFSELITLKSKYWQLLDGTVDQPFSAVTVEFDKLKSINVSLREIVGILSLASKTSDSRQERAHLQQAKAKLKKLKSKTEAVSKSLEKIVVTDFNETSLDTTMCHEVTQHFTVVSIDMVEYGKLSVILQDISYKNSRAVLEFNAEIQKLFETAIGKAEIVPETVRSIGTGDGGIFFFESAADATTFSLEVKALTKIDNNQNNITPKFFRTGLATGEVSIREKRNKDGRFWRLEAGGAVIARAVRIQSACRPGEILACRDTFTSMTSDQHKLFNKDKTVIGKGHEKLKIRTHSHYLKP